MTAQRLSRDCGGGAHNSLYVLLQHCHVAVCWEYSASRHARRHTELSALDILLQKANHFLQAQAQLLFTKLLPERPACLYETARSTLPQLSVDLISSAMAQR
jgi:hypothetical protein